ncbi:hypothetical protein CKA32_007098 [Geitlerinema sp. FC II]|nr:hypothetical protein CKA32_007098 [Geitlerinema sp. FC II]
MSFMYLKNTRAQHAKYKAAQTMLTMLLNLKALFMLLLV